MSSCVCVCNHCSLAHCADHNASLISAVTCLAGCVLPCMYVASSRAAVHSCCITLVASPPPSPAEPWGPSLCKKDITAEQRLAALIIPAAPAQMQPERRSPQHVLDGDGAFLLSYLGSSSRLFSDLLVCLGSPSCCMTQF